MTHSYDYLVIGSGIAGMSSVAAYIGCVACDTFPEVMLCDNLYCEMMLEHIDA